MSSPPAQTQHPDPDPDPDNRAPPQAAVGWSSLLARWWAGPAPRILAVTAAIILSATIYAAIRSDGPDLVRAGSLLLHPAAGWLALAIGCELAAYLAYSAGQTWLLSRVAQRPSIWWLGSLAVSAQALNNFLPAGYLIANVFNFHCLSRKQVGRARSGWLLVTTSTLYLSALAVCGAAGGILASERHPAWMWRWLAGVAGLVLAGLACWLAIRVLRRRRARAGHAGIQLWHPVARAHASLRGARVAVTGMTPGKGPLAAAGALFLCSWVTDALCLLLSILTTGGTVPWPTFLAVYCGAQLASFIPLTPGGLGLVEGGLVVGLSAATGHDARIVAAVAFYRLISYWATLPVGTALYLAVLRRGRQPAAQS